MSESNKTPTTYRVIRGSIKLPRELNKLGKPTGIGCGSGNFIRQGSILPPGIFPDTDIQSWLKDGRIEVAQVPQEGVEKASEAVTLRNPFQVDPVSLVGKTMEELMLMIFDISKDYDTDGINSEQDAVRLLTSGWSGARDQFTAPVTDRSSAEALKLNDMTQTLDKGATSSFDAGLSDQSQGVLDAARAKAQAPAEDLDSEQV